MSEPLAEKTISESEKNIKPILIIIISILITAVLVGGTVYGWQKSLTYKSEAVLKQQVQDLQQQLLEVKGNEPSMEEVEENDTVLKTYQNTTPKLTFSYPQNWGEVELKSSAGEGAGFGYDQILIFSDVKGQGFNSDGGFGSNAGIRIKKYDLKNRYQISSKCFEGDCDEKEDLIQEKASIVSKSNITIAGIKGSMKDYYHVPSGYMVREYTFFTDTYKINIFGSYDIAPLYEKEYEEEQQNSSIVSLQDIIRKDLGPAFANGDDIDINLLLNKHPQETIALQEFYKELDAVVQSIQLQ